MPFDGRGSRSFATLVRDLAHEGTSLVRDEVKLARIEIEHVAKNVGKSTIFIAIGTVFVLLGGLALLTGIVLLIGDQWLPRDMYWLAALMVLVITGGLAVALAKRGMSLVAPSRLVPDETVRTIEEDKEWLKRRLTSGAT